jgi:hypothetical protein
MLQQSCLPAFRSRCRSPRIHIRPAAAAAWQGLEDPETGSRRLPRRPARHSNAMRRPVPPTGGNSSDERQVRLAIAATLLLGYLCYRLAGEAYVLVAIGLISFAAVAQFGQRHLIRQLQGLVGEWCFGRVAGIVVGRAHGCPGAGASAVPPTGSLAALRRCRRLRNGVRFPMLRVEARGQAKRASGTWLAPGRRVQGCEYLDCWVRTGPFG